MLRGPQTLGELRSRTERMYRFEDLESLEATLQKLSERQPPLVKKLPRLPGTKEPRYAQLLAGDQPEWSIAAAEPAPAPDSHAPDERVTQLAAEMEEIKRQLANLQQQFAEFKKQFE